MLRRIYALFVARNIEFYRDRAALAWSILLPIFLIIGFAYAFSNDNPEKFKVAYISIADTTGAEQAFLQTRYIQFIEVQDNQIDIEQSLRKVERHQIDLLFDAKQQVYWLNQTSPNGYIVEKLLLAAYADTSIQLKQNFVEGDEIRYVDWVIPGILAMNIMWGALFGIGYVIVRYRKMGVLKRLRATPVSAMEFLVAQVASRLWLLLLVNSLIFIGLNFFINFSMYGSYFLLFLVFLLGCICLICCGLMIAARISSEEVAGGLLNFFSWPMMFLSGVWFSLEGAHPAVQILANFLPLTHVTEAAREIMIDGHGLFAIADHLLILLVSSGIMLLIGVKIFRWE